MTRKFRLSFLAVSLVVLVIVGRITTGGFDFFLNQFWFTSGLFLLVLLSLVDQPFFSKDSNIFANGLTAWMSLLLIKKPDRSGMWILFFTWATYLIVSSYVFMFIRSRRLSQEVKVVAALSRFNRIIGSPEALFSALFIWGAARQFGIESRQFDSLMLYWTVFTVLNVPAMSNFLVELPPPK
jgi:uncharacterized protein